MQRESRTIEYKREISEFRKIAQTVIAFANGLGGEIFVGIEDKTLKVVGLPSTEIEELLERLPISLADQISPALLPLLFSRTIDGKEVLVIQVFPGPQKPYYLTQEGLERGVYIRVGSHTRRAEGELLEELRLQKLHIGYDEAPLPPCPTNELDLSLLPASLRSEKALYSLDILKRDPTSGEVHPSRGAVLMLHKTPEKYIPEAEIIISRMRGNSGRSTIESHTLSGPLPVQAEQGLELLLRWLGQEPELKKGRYLNQKFKLPPDALRETLHNALFHRQYSIPGAIKIALYTDRLEIFSPGHFVGPFVFEALGDGSSYIRNRIICTLARRMGLIEKRGTGIMVIISSMKSYGLNSPLFTEGPNFFKVTLDLTKSGEDLSLGLDQKIMRLFETKSSISSSDICKLLKVSKATAVSYLQHLIQADKIQRIGSGPKTRYIIEGT